MKKIALSVIVPMVFILGNYFPSFAQGLKIYSENPFYWEYKGKPVFLIGGSSTDNIFQIENLEEELNLLKSIGGNYLRCTMNSRVQGNEKPFLMEDGLYNLDKPNPVFWEEKFDRFLAMAHEREIVPQIEIWATYDYYAGSWDDNVWNPSNNSAYDANNSNLTETVDYRAQMKVNPFFETVPALNNDGLVLEYQKKFVDLILSYSFKYDNILYCIDNETNSDPRWGEYWATYLRQKAEVESKTIYITEMWDNWDPTDGAVEGVRKQHAATHPFLERSKAANTINNPQLYDYVDISNNNAQNGEVHYQSALYIRNWIQKTGKIRPINNTKIYGGEIYGPGFEDWSGSFKDGEERIWRDVFAGHASVRFHRPTMGHGLTSIAQAQIKSLRIFSDEIDIYNNVPANNLLHEREGNEAFCMALNIPNEYQYAVYFPGEGSVKLQTPNRGTYELRWLHIRSSIWRQETEKIKSWSGTIHINTPDKDQWAVIIKKISSPVAE